jgi:L-lactate dehydrogenase complex protein LldF
MFAPFYKHIKKTVKKQNPNPARGGGGELLERLAVKLWRFSMENKTVYNLLSSLSYFLQYPWLSNDGKLQFLPFPLSLWTKQRDFPAVARKTFRKRWKEIKKI